MLSEPHKPREGVGTGLQLSGGSPAYMHTGQVQQTTGETEKLKDNDSNTPLCEGGLTDPQKN